MSAVREMFVVSSNSRSIAVLPFLIASRSSIVQAVSACFTIAWLDVLPKNRRLQLTKIREIGIFIGVVLATSVLYRLVFISITQIVLGVKWALYKAFLQ